MTLKGAVFTLHLRVVHWLLFVIYKINHISTLIKGTSRPALVSSEFSEGSRGSKNNFNAFIFDEKMIITNSMDMLNKSLLWLICRDEIIHSQRELKGK